LGTKRAEERIILTRALRAGALETPRGIFGTDRCGWQCRWLWILLWNMAGRRAQTVTTNLPELMGLLRKKEPRTIRDYLDELEQAGAIERCPEPNDLLRIYVADPDSVDPLLAIGRPSDSLALFDKHFLPAESPPAIAGIFPEKSPPAVGENPVPSDQAGGVLPIENATVALAIQQLSEGGQARNGESAPGIFPEKSPARDSLFGGRRRSFKLPPPPASSDRTTAASLRARLGSLGMAVTDAPVEAAAEAGLSLPEIAQLVDFWELNRPAWELGALFKRLLIARPGLGIADAWPKPSDNWRKAEERKSRGAAEKRRLAASAAEEARLDADARAGARLESKHGPTLDAMTDEEAAGLLERSPAIYRDFIRSRFRAHGRKADSVRLTLLQQLEAESGEVRT
jgi:hypothetical protein